MTSHGSIDTNPWRCALTLLNSTKSDITSKNSWKRRRTSEGAFQRWHYSRFPASWVELHTVWKSLTLIASRTIVMWLRAVTRRRDDASCVAHSPSKRKHGYADKANKMRGDQTMTRAWTENFRPAVAPKDYLSSIFRRLQCQAYVHCQVDQAATLTAIDPSTKTILWQETTSMRHVHQRGSS